MQPFTLGILLIALLCGDIFAEENSHLARPKSDATPHPSKTSYSTPISGPQCTGCFLEALTPTPLSYPGTVYCLDLTFIETVYLSIRYTIVKPDGCTTTTVVPNPSPPTDGPISTTSITWETSGTSLTWPTTYNAYSAFEAGTWSHGGASDCTIHPTTVYAQSPIIYPASSFPASLAPVPSQVIQSMIQDPSINLPFDIATCTANGALPDLMRADLEPACSCTTGSPPPQSCIQLPASTTTRSNSFIHSGYGRYQAATPPALFHVARQAAAAEADGAATATTSHTRRTILSIVDGGMLISEATNRSGITSTPSTTRTTSTNRSTSSSTSSTNLSFNNSLRSTSSAARSSGSSFAA